jgi:hypothetical protein
MAEARSTAAKVGAVAVGALLAFYGLLIVAPWHFTFPSAGLDYSWTMVIDRGYATGAQWGRDLVFTFGPYGFAYTYLFSEQTFTASLLINLLRAGAIFYALGSLLRPLGLAAIPLSLILVVPFESNGRNDFGFFFLPLLIALCHFRRPTPVSTRHLAVLSIIVGFGALVKLTFAVAGFLFLGLVDADRMRHRRAPLHTPLLLITFLVLYVAAGQQLSHLPAYLGLSQQIISGYTDAMSIWGSARELTVFLVLSAAVFGAVLWEELKVSTDRVGSLLLLLVLSLFWFLCFKAGFVRHDMHTLTSWAALAGGAVAYGAMAWPRAKSQGPAARRLPAVILFTAAIVSSTALALLWHGWDRTQLLGQLRRSYWDIPVASLGTLGRALAAPGAWYRGMVEVNTQALQQLASQPGMQELEGLDGSIDTVPSIQGSLIAKGLDYRPRPVFQEYSVYTPALIAANAAYLSGPKAPDYLLFAMDTLDGRHPAATEGAQWPLILERYEPLRFTQNGILMRRRNEGLTERVLDPSGATATSLQLGAELALPEGHEGTFLKVRVRKSLAGKLSNLLLKSPQLFLVSRLVDGTERRHRLIPDMAVEGFMISPYVDSEPALAAVVAGVPEALAYSKVVSIRVEPAKRGRFAYDDRIDVELIPMRLRHLRLQDPSSPFASPLLLRSTASMNALQALLASAAPGSVETRMDSGVLFSHAPSTLSLAVRSAQRIQVKFGLRDGAWQEGGTTDGVCFRISSEAPPGAQARLWERCLDPAANPADRQEQAASLDTQLTHGGRLILETACRSHCSWDWSYWSALEIDP